MLGYCPRKVASGADSTLFNLEASSESIRKQVCSLGPNRLDTTF